MHNKRLDLVFLVGFALMAAWTAYYQDWLLAGLSALGFVAYLWRYLKLK